MKFNYVFLAVFALNLMAPTFSCAMNQEQASSNTSSNNSSQDNFVERVHVYMDSRDSLDKKDYEDILDLSDKYLLPCLMNHADAILHADTILLFKRTRWSLKCLLVQALKKHTTTKKVRAMGNSLLHFAAAVGDEALVEKFLQDDDLAIDMENKSKDTPLYIAQFLGRSSIATFLIEHGAPLFSPSGGPVSKKCIRKASDASLERKKSMDAWDDSFSLSVC